MVSIAEEAVPDSEIPLSVDGTIEGRLAADETLWVERVRAFVPLTCMNVSSCRNYAATADSPALVCRRAHDEVQLGTAYRCIAASALVTRRWSRCVVRTSSLRSCDTPPLE